MENKEIRNYAQQHGVKLWEIAESLCITDATFSRKLRRELSATQQEHICQIIEKIAERKAEKDTERGGTTFEVARNQ